MYAIQAKNLSKLYDIDHKIMLGSGGEKPLIHGADALRAQAKKVYALQDINLTIESGSIVGIMGHNGSGKSTLLKVISGITKPTSGEVIINGKIASILEVGTGFHSDLSGRENIYFSAGLLGLSTRQINAIEQKIIDFSELGDFIDIKIKYYSSGMNMRLAFSLISFIEADIVLLDEVFAVGDMEFKQKCEKRIIEMSKGTKTIIMVSHDLGTISKICNHYIWIDEGKIKSQGSDIQLFNNYLLKSFAQIDTPESIDDDTSNSFSFKKTHLEKNIFLTKSESGPITSLIKRSGSAHLGDDIEVTCYTHRKSEDNVFFYNEPITISCLFHKPNEDLIFPVFALSYQASSLAIACHPGMAHSDWSEMKQSGSFKFLCTLPPFFLNRGLFGLNLYFLNEQKEEIRSFENILSFSLIFNENLSDIAGSTFNGPIMSKLDWKIIKTS